MSPRIRIALPALVAAALASSVARAADAPPTFAEIAPILHANCASCHHAGEIGPMSLLSYEEVRPWAKSIRKSVAERSMPPFHVDTKAVHYKNDASLSQKDIDAILAWVDAGSPQGDPAAAPAPPAFPDTWTMGEPDLIFHGTQDTFLPAHATDREIGYLGRTFDTSALTEDVWIQGWEIRGTAKGVIHHANLALSPAPFDTSGGADVIGQAVRPGGDYIGSYLPGCRPMFYPEGTAYLLPKGYHLGIQVHYVGGEKDQTDHLMFGVRFAQGRIDKRVRVVGLVGVDSDLSIPPHTPDWVLAAEVNLIYDTILLSSGAHMHLRGSKYLHETILPDGSAKLLAWAPNYDFNWQSTYWLAEPILAPKGSKVRTYAHYDNTSNNPNVDRPDIHVKRGSWTEDEMLNSWAHAVLADEKMGLMVKDGKAVGRADDAVESEHPTIFQGLVARRLSKDGIITVPPVTDVSAFAPTEASAASETAGAGF